MASGTDRRVLAIAAAGSAGLSGALFYFGTGLEPIGWLVWLAPLPVLLFAQRATARVAGPVAFVAYLLGTLTITGYYLSDLELPAPLVAAMFVGTSAIFAGAVLAFRALVIRRHPLLAALTFAAVLAGAEYLVATVVPGGASWSLAPTQADLLVVLQVASVTGIWGVSFLVLLVPAAVAAMGAPQATRSGRLRVGIAAAAVVVASLAYGMVRLDGGDDGSSVRVALLAADLTADTPIVELDSGEGRRLLDDDVTALRALPSDTQIAVLPEKDLLVDDTSLPALSRRFASVARERNLTVVAGVESHEGGDSRNLALIFTAGTGARTTYVKQNLLPGLEDAFIAGDSNTFVPGFAHSIGVAICADMGHPDLGRSYAQDGAQMMLVPALDFTVDAESQSRVQYLRGVENGYSVARPSRLGYLTLTDPNGRVLEQADADGPPGAAWVVADLPMGSDITLYTRWGDWFGMFCMALGAVGIAVAAAPRRFGSSWPRTRARNTPPRPEMESRETEPADNVRS